MSISIDEARKNQESRDSMCYRVIGIMTEDGNDASQRLRNAVMHSLSTLRDTLPPEKKPLLYWRYSKECRIEEEVEPEVNARGHRMRRFQRRKIYVRIAIPGADWSKIDTVKPEGEPYARI